MIGSVVALNFSYYMAERVMKARLKREARTARDNIITKRIKID